MSKREKELVRSTRESEMRTHEALMEYNMDYVSPLDMPPGVARDGYVYYWATKDIRGEPTYEVEQLCGRGHWEIVPIERFPNYSGDPLKRNPYAAQYFCYRDVILLERPEIFSIRQREMEYRNNDKTVRSLVGVTTDIINPQYMAGMGGRF